MIKVLHVVSSMSLGGVETLLRTYYENMDRSMFSFDFACYTDYYGPSRKILENMGCKVFNIVSKKKILASYKNLYKVCKDGNYDIIHVHLDDKSMLPIICAKHANIPIRIVHAHLGKYGNWINELEQKIEKFFIFKFANAYFACSQKASEEFFGKNKEVFIMNNSIEYSKFEFSASERKKIRKDLKINDDEIVIGNIARLAEQKNVMFLLNVFKKLSDNNSKYKLLLVGEGNLKESIKEFIKENRLESKAILLGSKVDAYRYYNALDIFTLPSKYEGLGISFIEAQINGIETLASTAVPIETKISNNIQYLPIDNSVDLWVESIKKIKYQRKNENVIDKKYDIHKSVTLLENQYIELLKNQERK